LRTKNCSVRKKSQHHIQSRNPRREDALELLVFVQKVQKIKGKLEAIMRDANDLCEATAMDCRKFCRLAGNKFK
jgi:hypothetical protein